MTPEQQSALEGVRGGDLVLLITAGRLSSSRLLLVHSVRTVGTMTRRTVHVRGPESLHPQEWLTFHRDPTNFWRNFQHGRPLTAVAIIAINTLLSREDTVLIRPSFDDLFRPFFRASCPFLYCREGLVSVSGTVRSVLRDTAHGAARFGERNVETLCPFCMGAALHFEHESEVERCEAAAAAAAVDSSAALAFALGEPEQWRQQEQQQQQQRQQRHWSRIVARRAELGYAPLARRDDNLMSDLRLEGEGVSRLSSSSADITPYSDALEATAGGAAAVLDSSAPRDHALRRRRSSSSRTDTDELVVTLRGLPSPLPPTFPPPPPTPPPLPTTTTATGPPTEDRSSERHASPPPPAPIMTPVQRSGVIVIPTLRAREWYDRAAARVLARDSCCAICLEVFAPRDVVADLPCWHFFHAACWAQVEGGGRGRGRGGAGAGAGRGGKCPFRCNEVRG